MKSMVLVLVLAVAPACTRSESPTVASAPQDGAGKASDTMISEQEARAIAERDAPPAYGKLDGYELRAELKDGKWHLEYRPGGGRDGGGPVYVIDARTGAILDKKYYQ